MARTRSNKKGGKKKTNKPKEPANNKDKDITKISEFKERYNKQAALEIERLKKTYLLLHTAHGSKVTMEVNDNDMLDSDRSRNRFRSLEVEDDNSTDKILGTKTKASDMTTGGNNDNNNANKRPKKDRKVIFESNKELEYASDTNNNGKKCS